MKERHSVRRYHDKKIEGDMLEKLGKEIGVINSESGLSVQLVTDEPEAFSSMAHSYGMFTGVSNYFAIVGKKTPDLEEKAGYYGERLVLFAQTLGLSTCWVAGTYSKKKARIKVEDGEKIVCVIAVGYGAEEGRQHRNKPVERLCLVKGEMPGWFRSAMEVVMLAPTAINQQKFLFTLVSEDTVNAKAKFGPKSKVDLGIVKYHFEIGAGDKEFTWV